MTSLALSCLFSETDSNPPRHLNVWIETVYRVSEALSETYIYFIYFRQAKDSPELALLLPLSPNCWVVGVHHCA